MAITTVFFDFGNTIVALTSSSAEIWCEVLQDRGVTTDPKAVDLALHEADAALTQVLYDYKGRMREFWTRYDAMVLHRLGIADSGRALAASIDRGFEDPRWFHVFPETREVLDSLRGSGLALGVISNNTSDLIDRLDRLDLARYFDHVTYSQEVRAEKPAPAVFRLALSRARCAPTQAVHVGDSFAMDVVGARGVGIEPILLDREDRFPTAECRRIRDLRELVPLLRNF